MFRTDRRYLIIDKIKKNNSLDDQCVDMDFRLNTDTSQLIKIQFIEGKTYLTILSPKHDVSCL